MSGFTYVGVKINNWSFVLSSHNDPQNSWLQFQMAQQLYSKASPLFVKIQPEGHTFNYSCGKFDGEEKGFSPCSQYNKFNTENTFGNDKIRTYF